MPLPKLDEVPEFQLAEDGQHELEIVRVTEKRDKNGLLFWLVNFRFMDDDNAADMSHFMYVDPDEHDDPRKAREIGTRLRKFMQSFGLTGEETADEVVGSTGSAFIGTKYDNYNEDYVNNIKAFA